MKWMIGLALAASVALAGCNRAPTATADSRDVTAPSDAKRDDPPAAPVAFNAQTGSLVSPEEVPLLEQINRENTRVVSAALPSIVRITATRPVDPHTMRLFGNELPFQLPFPGAHRYVPSNDTSYGSGVVLSRDGYILTNEHVIEESSLLQVQLADKRSFNARVVAADDLVDVAILKIDATGLRPLPWGDSDRVQVGEQVFAIGNPFDLDDSVSKGIVSAKGRNLPDSPLDGPHYEDYIQTDAAINPGNSGGALINIRGELVGLNAAIASTSRVNMGIGFAIPSNLVRYAVEGLLKEGHLVRGYLGVILPISVDDGVSDQLDLKSSEGAFLAGIRPGSPADKAKLGAWDFVTAVDGHKIDSEAALALVVAQVPVGKEVRVDFVRNGKPLSAEVKISDPPPDDEADSGPDNAPDAAAGNLPFSGNVLGGVQVADLNDKSRQKFGVDSLVTSGVVVTGVQEGSVADLKGIARGNVIESASIDRGSIQPVATPKDFAAIMERLKVSDAVALLVHDRQGASILYLTPPVK
jgi:serine protease Do